MKTRKESLEDVLLHILTICSVYQSSMTKVERIEQYVMGVLESLKGKENVQDNNNSKAGRKGKRTVKV